MFVIAHRGANRYAPQNTIEAFKKALEQNADGVETDVHMTKDGHIVLCHNSTIKATSDGKGKIKEKYLAELFSYDFGSWFGSVYANTNIPTIDEFLQTMKEKDAGIIDIEVKPNAYNSREIVSRIIKLAQGYGLTQKLLISSFDIEILKTVKQINPCITTGYLYPKIGEIVRRWFSSPWLRAVRYGVDYLLPEQAYVNKEFVRGAHAHGLKVAPWTVNKIETINNYKNWGVDGIITDYPEIMKNKISVL